MKKLIDKKDIDFYINNATKWMNKNKIFYNVALKEYKGKQDGKIWLIIG